MELISALGQRCVASSFCVSDAETGLVRRSCAMYARTRLGFADIARLGQIEGWRNHERLRQLCRDKGLTGNDLPDAWLMAAFAQRGEHPVSFDRGFKKLIGRAQFTLPVGNAESKGADRCLVADLLQARAIGAQFDAVVWILADVDV